MGVARFRFYYAEPEGRMRDGEIVSEIRANTDELEGYRYRRVDTELRHRGVTANANAKKVRRMLKENDLNRRGRRRLVRDPELP